MSEWNETCSQAPSNKPISDEKLKEIKRNMQFVYPDKEENIMALHPGEAGHDEAFEEKANKSSSLAGKCTTDRRAQQFPYTGYEDKVVLGGCTEMSPRNRRAYTRIGDIVRAVDKVVPDEAKQVGQTQGTGQDRSSTSQFPKIDAPDPKLLEALDKARKAAEATTGTNKMPGQELKPVSYTTTMLDPMFDKNTSGSLKQLRWEIYDLIERYEGDYGRTISMTLRSEIEDLFKRYTHS